MGKRFAPAYANIYLADWEETVFLKCSKHPLHYFRYLDDIWGIWEYSMEDFHEFVGVLNDHHVGITLEPTIHPSSVDFLDTTVFKGENFVEWHPFNLSVFQAYGYTWPAPQE